MRIIVSRALPNCIFSNMPPGDPFCEIINPKYFNQLLQLFSLCFITSFVFHRITTHLATKTIQSSKDLYTSFDLLIDPNVDSLAKSVMPPGAATKKKPSLKSIILLPT
jgi:hypothetical protein